jgi:aspartate-semialdehyde dehydrogenase
VDASTEIALKRLFPASPMMVGCQSVVLPEFFGLAVGVVVHGHGQLDTASALSMLEADGLEVVEQEQQEQSQNLLEGLEPVSTRVSNLRCQTGDGTRLQAWLSADMIRGCAARNCVQTVELLLKDYS